MFPHHNALGEELAAFLSFSVSIKYMLQQHTLGVKGAEAGIPWEAEEKAIACQAAPTNQVGDWAKASTWDFLSIEGISTLHIALEISRCVACLSLSSRSWDSLQWLHWWDHPQGSPSWWCLPFQDSLPVGWTKSCWFPGKRGSKQSQQEGCQNRRLYQSHRWSLKRTCQYIAVQNEYKEVTFRWLRCKGKPPGWQRGNSCRLHWVDLSLSWSVVSWWRPTYRTDQKQWSACSRLECSSLHSWDRTWASIASRDKCQIMQGFMINSWSGQWGLGVLHTCGQNHQMNTVPQPWVLLASNILMWSSQTQAILHH